MLKIIAQTLLDIKTKLMGEDGKKTEAQIQKDLINLRGENDAKHHEMKMEELEYIRKTEEIHHDHEMSRQSIKTAEIKKAFERKQASQYLRKQW